MDINKATLLPAHYSPNPAHFDKTWKADGTTITEGGYVGTSDAWSPALLICLYVLAGFVLSICIVGCALSVIYDGDIMAAFRKENDNNYQYDNNN